MRLVLLVAALTLAVPARAQVAMGTLTPRRLLLGGSEGQNPVSDTRASLFLIGLGLVGAGLVLGGAGFAILYVCREGEQCYGDQTLRTAGWVLAAPGIIPLVVGVIMLYAGVGGSSSGGGGSKVRRALPVTLGFAPLPGGGGFATGTFNF
ncbi:MAG: hypothetical protein JNK82_21520 [Myxococcaceae bacterium]|nr:hypothetical protein [Myxococcaceae bacterium]